MVCCPLRKEIGCVENVNSKHIAAGVWSAAHPVLSYFVENYPYLGCVLFGGVYIQGACMTAETATYALRCVKVSDATHMHDLDNSTD